MLTQVLFFTPHVVEAWRLRKSAKVCGLLARHLTRDTNGTFALRFQDQVAHHRTIHLQADRQHQCRGIHIRDAARTHINRVCRNADRQRLAVLVANRSANAMQTHRPFLLPLGRLLDLLVTADLQVAQAHQQNDRPY